MAGFVEFCGWGWSVFALLLVTVIAVNSIVNGKSMKEMINEDRMH